MNKRAGMYASLLTLAGVLGFAVSMAVDSNPGAYLASMFIAWGFVPLISSFAAYGTKEVKTLSYTAIAFASIYAVLVMLVYFAQLTTVRLETLNGQAAQVLDYSQFGLFFNYDLLGYAFMALATFCIAWTVRVRTRGDQWLKGLLLVHGIFAVSCVLLPMLGLFKADMQGGDWIGTLVLGIWCLYFIPVCVLSYLHFKRES